MDKEIVRSLTPEEEELEKKLAELAALERQLADQELELATLSGELVSVERQYLAIVGVLYAELDEIRAQIAEALIEGSENPAQTRQAAQEARTRAEETAEATGEVRREEARVKFEPSEDIKKLYREIAKKIHPDYAETDKERERMTRLMAEANEAYQSGDKARLEAILREWEGHPESIKGETTGDKLVRAIRNIALAQERLRVVGFEIESLMESELYELKTRIEEAENEGRDLLQEMAERVAQDIEAAKRKMQGIPSK